MADFEDLDDSDFSGWAMTDAATFDNLRATEERQAADTAERAAASAESATPTATEPVYTAGDYATALGQLDKDLDALAAKYETGEIEFRNYRAEERRLENVRSQLGSEYARRRNAEELKTARWNADVSRFFSTDEGRLFAPGTGLNAALSETVGAHLRAGKPATLGTLKAAAKEARQQLRAAVGLGGSRRTAAVSTRDREDDDDDNDYSGWAASSWR